MSPSASTTPQGDPERKATAHSRQGSTATVPAPPGSLHATKPSKQASSDPQSNASYVHYTVFIRLPLQRGDFQDPPPVEWDTAKDKALWKLISKASSSKELDWEDMSARFQVDLEFLLQQAAWLYERHFEGMKLQMKKLGVGVGGVASPNPASGEGALSNEDVTGEASLGNSGKRDSQRPSAITTQRNSPLPPAEGSNTPETPRSYRPEFSRTPSTTTVTQSRVFASRGRRPSQGVARDSHPKPGRQNYEADHTIDHDAGADSESEEESSAMARSQAFRRLPISKKPVVAPPSSDGDAEDDEDDSSGGFLPFASKPTTTKDTASTTQPRPSNKTDSATPREPHPTKTQPRQPADSSTSSASSTQPHTTNNNNTSNPDTTTRPGPLSPRYRAELEKLSPRYKKSGSEGSRSMGSSFSDLEDASVTQSALEDALLSNMQQGGSLAMGMGSKIGGLRDALGRKQ